MQLREVLFHILIVWSSPVEICACQSSFRWVVRVAHNPGHLMMELNGANVVEMAMEGKEAAAVLRADIWTYAQRGVGR